MKSPLFLSWLITFLVIILLCLSVAFAHLYTWQNPLGEEERIFWRTVSYLLSILILPFTGLLRHVFSRLNQTIPLLEGQNLARVCQTRYTLTVTLSMLLMLFVGSLGAINFYWGDGFNTLYILSSVASLGIFLYRPKWHEYLQIHHSLSSEHRP